MLQKILSQVDQITPDEIAELDAIGEIDRIFTHQRLEGILDSIEAVVWSDPPRDL